MTITRFKIIRKIRELESIRSVNFKKDFLLEKDGIIENPDILKDKSYSLYCIDQDERVVAFLHISEPLNVEENVFLYQDQYKFADNVIVVPYEVFFRVFEEIDCPSENVCMLFSVGRCGSTLLQKILGALPCITSVSEADVYSHVSELLRTRQIDDSEAVQLFRCATKHFWNANRKKENYILLLKFRSEVVSYSQLLQAIPTTKLLFMYRKPDDVIQSFGRMAGFSMKKDWFLRHRFLSIINKYRIQRVYLEKENIYKDMTSLLKGIKPLDLIFFLRPNGYFFLWWLLKVNMYMKMRAEKIPIVALRYEDLINNPERTIRLFLEHVGLETEGVEEACRHMQHDSQGGTSLAKSAIGKYCLNSKMRADIDSAIQLYTGLSGVNHILDGTLGHDNG